MDNIVQRNSCYNSIFLTSQIYENVTAHALTQGISTFPGSRLEGLRLSLITNITHNRNYSLIVLCLSKISLSHNVILHAHKLRLDDVDMKEISSLFIDAEPRYRKAYYGSF